MKSILLITLIFTSVYCTHQNFLPNDRLGQLNHFKEYLTKFQKSYVGQEFEKRLEIFIQNHIEVSQMNERFSESTQFEVNQFTDLSKEEFRNTVLMKATFQQDINEPKNNFGPFLSMPVTLPDNLNWKNATSPVKDQGSCGSCWAFSVAQDIESRWFLATGQKKNLSIEQIIECDPRDTACYGGWTYNGLQYVIDNGGLAEESIYPYNGDKKVICLKNQTFNLTCPVAPNDPPCTNFCELKCKENVKITAKISSYQRIPQDEEQMKNYLAIYGPYSIALDADGLQSYKSGIYKGGWFGCGTSINHAVFLVGYGTEKGTDYWLVKNSWGASWGENGYFRIQRGKNMCNIKSYPMHSIVQTQEEIEIQ